VGKRRKLMGKGARVCTLVERRFGAVAHPTHAAIYSANTYSTVEWRWSRSSGVFMSLDFAAPLGPETIATYCLPLTSNVIGGAAKPEPTLIFHSSSSV